MIRVLHVVTILNRGGIETMLMNYYRNLDRTKVQFDFLVHREVRGDYEGEIESLGGKIYRMPPITPQSIISYNRRMKKFLSEHKQYRIIHSHIDTLSSLPLRASMEMGIPVRIAHCHTIAVNRDLKAPVRMFLKRTVTKYANYYFACSMKAGVWFFGEKNQKRVHILKNAIRATDYSYNMNKAKQIRTELSNEGVNLKGKWIIGHVGNFTIPKNHSFLIDVFNEIHKMNSDACLLLIGDGQLRQKIEEKVSKMGLKDSVLFLGFRSDVLHLLQVMNLFLFPSLYEGLPVSLIEAQASGLPCIVSNRVTEEVRVTEQIEFLALEDGPKNWANKVMEYSHEFVRKDTYSDIKQAGYDIVNSAKILQDIYIRWAGKNETENISDQQ